jgi:sigma-B regulation protein RsbU (phosphoserine phosphatase)
MTILVADDHETNRKLLSAVLSAEGYTVRQVSDGGQALAELHAATEPLIGLIDWQMPVQIGPEVCRAARQAPNAALLFLILVTARGSMEDVVAGLNSGANDYVTKPFVEAELLARVRIGVRMLELQQTLANRVQELETALAQVKQLHGLLPICSYCKSIRDDRNYWRDVENYIAEHSPVQFSHGVCPDCFTKHVQPELEALGVKPSDVDELRSIQPKPGNPAV